VGCSMRRRVTAIELALATASDALDTRLIRGGGFTRCDWGSHTSLAITTRLAVERNRPGSSSLRISTVPTDDIQVRMQSGVFGVFRSGVADHSKEPRRGEL
jgi:hypothetical protein